MSESEYPRVDLTVDILLFSGKSILLIKRGREPYAGFWALPGGFLDADEDENLLAAARRELKEETGLQATVLYEIGSYSDIYRDPRGRVVSVAFAGLVDDEQLAQAAANDDASDARVFSLDNLPPMAFDHARIIEDAVEKMEFNSSTCLALK